MKSITLTEEECRAIHDMIGMMNGQNPEYVFSAFSTGEPDDPNDPYVSGFAKIYECAGQTVPDNMKGLK